MRIGFIALMIALLAAVPVVLWADQWQEVPGVLPPARYSHSMVELNGKLYVFGGMGNTRGVALSDLWRFENETWEEVTAANPPAARSEHTAAAANGKMYVFGGRDRAGMTLYDMWNYDPATNIWARSAMSGDVPLPRFDHTLVGLPDGRLIVFGGKFNETAPVPTYPYIYTPTTGVWVKVTTAAPFSSLYGHTAFVHDNKMYVFGGSSINNVTNSDIWVFDPTTSTWSQITPQGTAKPAARRFHYMTVTQDVFRIFGGESETEFSDSWEYTFASQTWTTRAAMPMPMSKGQAAALTSSRAVEDIFFGGVSGGAPITKSYAYVPDGEPPVTKAVTTYTGVLGQWQFVLGHLGFDKKQAKVNIVLTWTGNARLRLCAAKIPHHREHEQGLMAAPREDMDDEMCEEWANSHLAQAEELGEATAANEVKATLENVQCLIVMVRHHWKSQVARDVQLSITEFSDTPKQALYFFPLGSFPKVAPPLKHFVSLPVTPVRWCARVPHGIGEQTIETGSDFWKWVYTINKPRPFMFGWVRFALP